MRITELDLSPAARLCLEVADIYEVDRLLEHETGRLIQRPEFSKGAELYEIVRELHLRGLTFSRPGGHVQGERELEMFRLRAVVGLSLDEIGERFNLTRGRVHQLLRLHFRLDEVPPAATSAPAAGDLPSSAHRQGSPPPVPHGARGDKAPLPQTPHRHGSSKGARQFSPDNYSGHTLSSATAHSMKTSRLDGWTLPPNCSHSPRSR